MVDIRSIAGSSLPTQQGTEQEATSNSRVGRSCQMNAHDVSTAVGVTAAAAHQQHSAAMAVIPRSEIAGTKPPYVCPGCFIHTYSNNMINRFHVQ
jgi:hypothetical protein